jgi:PKD repeat protein
MRRHRKILIFSLFLMFSSGAWAGTSFKATTTLTAQTGNDTSAANGFTTQTNGNLGGANISKVSMHTLLYPGSSAKVYVHLVPWFGFGNHMNVGYASNDPAQVQRQLNDMVSRGIDGVIIDWFGQGTLNHSFAPYSQVVQDFKQDAEKQSNFNFAIMEDAGALQQCAATTGCDLTQTLINDLTYAYNNWENSPAYLHYNNRPVVYFFGEEAYTLNWTQVRASVPGNPMFIFRNTGAFNYAQSDGAFSWVAPETVSASDPMALLYVDYFDQIALSLWPEYSTESAYKGFNDSLAPWGAGRQIQQQCAQTWLASFAESGKFYSTSKQMLGIQIATWNDYEEGTEIEAGIDNCITLSAAANGTVLSWSLTGQVNTLDHYTVFLSRDGENLMWLADMPASSGSVDLIPYQMSAGTYTAYVQAVGKPSMLNHMSAGVSVTIPNQAPVAVLALSPTLGSAPLVVSASTAGSSDADGSIVASVINFGDGSASVNAASATHTYNSPGTYTVTATVTDNLGASASTSRSVIVATPFSFSGSSSSSASVTAGQSTTYDLVLAAGSSGFTGTVVFACSGAPAGTTCNVSPGSVSFTQSMGSANVTVTVATTAQAHSAAPLLKRGVPLLFATVFAGVFGASFSGRAVRLAKSTVLAGLLMLLLLGTIGCAGGASSTSSGPTQRSATDATLTVTATSGSQSATTTLALTINH